jgi:predicted transporter
MEYKSLILGTVFSIAIFAVKSGIGLNYYLSKTSSARVTAFVCSMFAVMYMMLFAASYFVISKIDIIRHQEVIMKWIESGMMIHLIMAVLMAFWGIWLLKGKTDYSAKSKGWIALAVPCPVCAMVILFCQSFFITFFPDLTWRSAVFLYLIFLLINFITVVIMRIRQQKMQPEIILGGAMLMIAVYFFLSVTIMPNFADLDRIYRLASNSSETNPLAIRQLSVVAVLGVLAFLAGFGAVYNKTRRTS